jgi:hypothetical protein
MATHRMSVIGGAKPDSGVPMDLIANQITEATTPSLGDLLCYVLGTGADEGVRGFFKVPKNYVGTPKLVFSGYLDGAPGASDTLGFAVRKRAVANNEAGDATFDAEQTVSSTIGSGGSGHSDEDFLEASVTLTAGDYAVDDQVQFWAYIDDSGSSYAGNFLLTDVEFEYADQ